MKPVQCAVVILVGVVCATYGHHHHHRHMCPPPFGKMMFDADKFQGDWYVVSHSVDTPHEHGEATCLRMSYTPSTAGNESRAHIKMDIRTPEKEHKVQLRCVQGGPPGKGGSTSLCAINLDESEKWDPLVQYQVLATDYETYAITMACGVYYKKDEEKFDRIFAVDVLSREPTLPADKLKLLKSVASSGEATFDSFHDINNEGC